MLIRLMPTPGQNFSGNVSSDAMEQPLGTIQARQCDSHPDCRAPTSPAAVLTDVERQLLERTTPEGKQKLPRDLNFYVRCIARLGGYLDRTSDAPPGTTVIWRGLSRLADLVDGARIAETPSA